MPNITNKARLWLQKFLMNNMDENFKNIKVLIWDFDKTLYPPNKQLSQEIRDKEFNVIMHHKAVSLEIAKVEFYKLYKIVTPSATEVIAKISGISIAQAAVEMEKQYDRRKFLKSDPRLKELFLKFHQYKHYILANGSIAKIRETLIYLGLTLDIFQEIVTSEIVGVNKPHLDGFKYIMQKTKLPVEDHLMIGDRETVDLAPAKELGMKTCLVWSIAKSSIADITINEIYELEKILL